MTLKNKYVIGVHVMFYELGMFSELVTSYIQMTKRVNNTNNIIFHFCINFQQYLERCSISLDFIKDEMFNEINKLKDFGQIYVEVKTDEDSFYNIAAFRRDLNYNYCDKVDYILWGESDSWFGRDTLTIIESLHELVSDQTPKFVLSFAQRKLWGTDWNENEHDMFKSTQYQDDDNWILINEASDKSYMSIDRMNEINDVDISNINIESWREPKFDGSCLVISSPLIASGINIPHALICSGEDTSFATMAKKMMGDQFVQYHCTNYLHVHNRRHPNKRNYILNEDNPQGFCDHRKGNWWKILETASKSNLDNLFKQKSFIKKEEVINEIKHR